jgi:hypothetical protein
MERRGTRTRFYSPKAVPRKEKGGFDSDSVGGNDGKKSVAGVEKKKMSPDRWDHGVSDTQRRKHGSALARACWAIGWAWPKRRSGTRAREKSEWASWWAAGPKAEKNEIFFFFFLFKYFKAFSIDFESYFEFESNHPTKNSNATA